MGSPLASVAGSLRFLALGASVALAACATSSGPNAAAEEETSILCAARVHLDESDERLRELRIRSDSARVSAGGASIDDTMARIARREADEQRACTDQILPALSGPGGKAALSVVRSAREACEGGVAPESDLGFVACFHARKLAIYRERMPEDGPAARETLDRLLVVGGGAPLTNEERAAYCEQRELAGTRHPICR